MDTDERRLALNYSFSAAMLKMSLESGISGSFRPPYPSTIEGIDELFQIALAAVNENYRPLSYQNPTTEALYYSMMAGILRRVEPILSTTKSLTKRLEQLDLALQQNMNPFTMEEKDAKSLISICGIIAETGESYMYEESIREDVSEDPLIVESVDFY